MTGPVREEAPAPDCPLCPRLVAFRAANRASWPDWHNAPVPSFGDADVRLLIVGLAPGLRGANRTSSRSTIAWSCRRGSRSVSSLIEHGFADGTYGATPADGMRLRDCRVTNAVRCVPPANKPETAEIAACRPFLAAEIGALPRLRAILALGGVAHKSTLAALGLRQSAFPCIHGAQHEVRPGLTLADSYHCSRYNTNTGRLTPAMFASVLAGLRALLVAA